MDREQLLTTIVSADPQPGDLVYVERRGDSYAWHRATDREWQLPEDPADSWIYYSWQRAIDDHTTARQMLEDLFAEMESMIGCGADRCRWPLDEPWPRTH